MRPPFAILTIANGVSACLMIAALSLLTTGAIGPLHALALAATILWGRWRGAPALRPIFWDVMALGALLLFPLDLFVISRSLIGAALRLLSFVVIYRCSNLTGRRELRQAVALSFVQILAAAASTTEAHFAVMLAAYLAMAIWTLMAMASARDDAPPSARRAPAGRPLAAMTASTAVLGGVLFFTMPHFGTGYLHQASELGGTREGLSGFSDRIELGSISRIKRNRAIVMRVKVEPDGGRQTASSGPLRWRGLALDTFDGRSWSVALPDAQWLGMDEGGWYAVAEEPDAPHAERVERISMEPSLIDVLFVPPGATRVRSEDLPAVGLDSGGSIHLQAPVPRRFTYTVSTPEPGMDPEGFGRMSPADRPRYLTLPRMEPQVEALARRVTQSAATDLDKARAIEDYLRANHAYTLEVDDAGVSDPVTSFLIEKRPGHCEYFATSMAIMARHLGMPARVVNGFASGQWSALAGAYIVRQSDAHSWVEVWIEARGWVTFDPTPSGPAGGAGLIAGLARGIDRLELLWDTWIIGLDLLDQQSLVVGLMEAAGRAAGALRRSLAAAATVFGWAMAAGAGLLLGGTAWFVTRQTRLWVRRRTRAGRTAARRSPATDMLRRFEARWAARGLRRAPGQTPLEFAREIERRALDAPGAALQFIQAYYGARYGPDRNPSTT